MSVQPLELWILNAIRFQISQFHNKQFEICRQLTPWSRHSLKSYFEKVQEDPSALDFIPHATLTKHVFKRTVAARRAQRTSKYLRRNLLAFFCPKV